MHVYLYRRANGRCPFEEYMQDIDDKHHRSFIHALIDKLAQQEGMLYPPHAKKVREKIWELRSPRGHRIFYFIDENRDAIILDGYTKKRQRIEPHVLEKIQHHYSQYLSIRYRKVYENPKNDHLR